MWRGSRWIVGFAAFVLGAVAGALVMWYLLRPLPDEPDLGPIAMTGPHLAVDGRPVLVKGLVPPRPGHKMTYRWDFGDGSDAVSGEVQNPYAIWQSHLYPTTAVGGRFVARLEVTDTSSGEILRGEVPVEFVEPTLENRRRIAAHDGLWSLHASMRRTDDPITGLAGAWKFQEYAIGPTALGVLAFEVNGYTPSRDPGHPYVETATRGLAHLVSLLEKYALTEQPAGNPDSNGNGFGLTVPGSKALYELPLVLMALVASGEPERVVPFGPEGVAGRSLKDIAIDVADLIAFAQCEENTVQRGGWRYKEAKAGGDMSATQWPALGLLAAEVLWSIPVPPWVRSELRDHFLVNLQGESGGFGYQNATSASIRLTAAGLISLSFAGVDSGDDRVRRAREWIGAKWKNSPNIGNDYAMYAVMKAARLSNPPVERFGDHDWFAEYVEHFWTTQEKDGSWPSDKEYGKEALAIAFPVLTLSTNVFGAEPPVRPEAPPSSDRRSLVLGIVPLLVAAALAIYLLVRRRRRAAGSPTTTTDSVR